MLGDAIRRITQSVAGFITTFIKTSTVQRPTGHSNQRKVDRTSNGNLHAIVLDNFFNSIASVWCSENGGVTWFDTGSWIANGSGVTNTNAKNASFFIDVDDFAHVVFKDNGDGHIYYRRGTPNASFNAWTWSDAVRVNQQFDYMDYPDLVVHREGSGWVVHVVFCVTDGLSDFRKAYYSRAKLNVDGSFSSNFLNIFTIIIQTAFANVGPGYPSIDFHHTGDGKTVKSVAPHLFVTASGAAAGSNYGTRFRKATYSGGSWVWEGTRVITTVGYVDDARWLQCMFDGTRVIIGGFIFSGSANYMALFERNVADTITTQRILTQLAGSSPETMFVGGLSYNRDADVHFIGRITDAGDQKIGHRVWRRGSNSLDDLEALVLASAQWGLFPSVKRGYSRNRIDFIYTTGASSPYNVFSGGVDA